MKSKEPISLLEKQGKRGGPRQRGAYLKGGCFLHRRKGNKEGYRKNIKKAPGVKAKRVAASAGDPLSQYQEPE